MEMIPGSQEVRPQCNRYEAEIARDKLAVELGTPPTSRIPGCTCTRVTLRGTLEFVIQAFADKDTEKLFNGRRVKKYSSELSDRALQKLLMLNAANHISDLRMPPGNRLEALVGDRKGQHSIRINDQYRICFVWTAAGPQDVQIVDYH